MKGRPGGWRTCLFCRPPGNDGVALQEERGREGESWAPWQPEVRPEAPVSGFCLGLPGDGGRPTEKHLENQRGLR